MGVRIARDFGISRDSVSKMLAYSEPPGYRRTSPIKRPKLDPYVAQIDSWLAEDKTRPRKQRHTAKRIFERLRDECRYDGGYTIVKDYVRAQKRGSREMFVPLSHPPGHGQADFGEALVVIGGIEQKAYFFAFDLPHSDACYIHAYPAANTEGRCHIKQSERENDQIAILELIDLAVICTRPMRANILNVTEPVRIRELDNPSGRISVGVSHLDQAAGAELACRLCAPCGRADA